MAASLPSLPLIPTPMPAVWIMGTSLDPSPMARHTSSLDRNSFWASSTILAFWAGAALEKTTELVCFRMGLASSNNLSF